MGKPKEVVIEVMPMLTVKHKLELIEKRVETQKKQIEIKKVEIINSY
jgi:hypothetical protein